MHKHIRGMNTIRITTIQMVIMNRMTTMHTVQATATHTISNPTLTITEVMVKVIGVVYTCHTTIITKTATFGFIPTDGGLNGL